jgi:Mor family transcriptional regulator
MTEQWVRLYTDGASLHDVARLYAVSVSTVYRRLKAAGVQMRPRGTRPRSEALVMRNREISAAAARGCRVCDLARRYGLTRCSIWMILREASGRPVRRWKGPRASPPNG